MAKILVAFATKYSQTQKIAETMGASMSRLGHKVDVFNIEKDDVFLDKYDAVIVGAPVFFGKYPGRLRKWVKLYSEILGQKPCAFFSVCLGVLQKDAKTQDEEREFVEAFFRVSNWYPQIWSIFAGALRYSQYNWLLKRIMHRKAEKSGYSTITTKDYEYTDWNDVSAFTERFLLTLNNSGDFRDSFPEEVISKHT
jgi:menaquinone-dependent protoporphyrinogen oxidase